MSLAKVHSWTKLHKKSTDSSGHKVVCYYTNWCQYRQGVGRYTISNIDPFLCTHLIYAFARIDAKTNKLDTYEWNDHTLYSDVNKLKKDNPKLKTLLSVGGANHGVESFRKVSETEDTRKAFAKNVVSFLRTHNFDGLDVNWEFPFAQDRDQFSSFIEALKTAFIEEAKTTGDDVMLLTCALGAARSTIEQGYDVEVLAKYCDFCNLMTYDLHGAWDSVTGFQSALYGFKDTDEFCQDWVVKQYIARGLPPDKIILGIPAYGRSFCLKDPRDHSPRAKCTKETTPPEGEFTKAAGIYSYYEICRHLSQGWTQVRDLKQKVVYAYKDNTWVAYDNPWSVVEKTKYAVEQSLGGVMFWELSLDDFNNQSGQGNYPLVRTAAEVLQQSSH